MNVGGALEDRQLRDRDRCPECQHTGGVHSDGLGKLTGFCHVSGCTCTRRGVAK